MSPAVLADILDLLETQYGPLEAPHPTDAVGLLLWENVAYLVDDAARSAAFDHLVAAVGRDPASILAASDATLLAAPPDVVQCRCQSPKVGDWYPRVVGRRPVR